MRDIVEILNVLPVRCAVSRDGVSYFIRRGANALDPTVSQIDVDTWNRQNHVEQWQVEAMKRGLHLGWEHALVEEETQPPRLWTVMIPLVLTGTVQAHSQDQVDEIVEAVRDGTVLNDDRFSISFDGAWELVDGPRELSDA